MNCPKCDNNLSWKDTKCKKCGQDLSTYRSIISASNMYFNDGLEKAKVRDLSGAIFSLKKSLKFNKKNTSARNLLGLIYFEMGEVVAALSEWVLSKHFQPTDNIADNYVNDVQSSPSRLDILNQAIKKYNTALIAAKQGNEDLAALQLKKVISLNPQFIRAYHLLAVLYLKADDKEKALKTLKKAASIDVNNITTLRYLKEVEDESVKKEVAATGATLAAKEPKPSYAPMSNYKEDRPNILAFVNMILGIIIGLAVTAILLVPNMEKRVSSRYVDKQKDYGEQISEKDSKISSLTDEKKKLEEAMSELKNKQQTEQLSKSETELYDYLFKAVQLYMNNEKDAAANALANVKEEEIKSDAAKEIYSLIKKDTFKKVSVSLFEQGRDAHNAGRYQEAIELLNKAVTMDPENVDAIYFLGRAYHRLNDFEKAGTYYNKVINDFPNSARVAEAKLNLKKIN